MRKLAGEKGNGVGQYCFKQTRKILGYVFVAIRCVSFSLVILFFSNFILTCPRLGFQTRVRVEFLRRPTLELVQGLYVGFIPGLVATFRVGNSLLTLE